MTARDTKTTILDAAERLFAEQGFAATSLRELTTRAGVNLAAVNYHFGSKEELAKAVLQRRIEPINTERRRRLDVLPRPAELEQVVRAFLEPVLLSEAIRPGDAGAGWCRLFGRMVVEQPPFLRPFLREQFGDLGGRFVAMLGEASPGTDTSTLWWRLHFVVGGMAHTLQNAHLIGQMSDGACDASDANHVLEQLVAFSIAGFTPAQRRPPRARRAAAKRSKAR